MSNIYYAIWADAILSFRKHHPNKDWKSKLFIYITWIHALNFWVIVLWIKYFNFIEIPEFSIDVFPGKLLDGFATFTIEFALPLGILNYFLIFHNNRHEKITKKYKDVKTRYAPMYSFTVAILAFVSAIIYGALT
jgi:hypothetical protein